jgi:hypothetical protein
MRQSENCASIVLSCSVTHFVVETFNEPLRRHWNLLRRSCATTSSGLKFLKHADSTPSTHFLKGAADTPLTLNERREGGIDLGLVASVQENQVQPKRVCRHLQVGSLVTGSRLVGSLSTPIVAALGVNPVQQLQSLSCERRGRIRMPVMFPPGDSDSQQALP